MKDHFLLNPNITFLNHGSFGATPKPVFETYQAWQRKLEEQPVLFLGRQYHELVLEAKVPLANYLGTAHQNLVFVPNATYAVNLIARSLNLQPGDEVLTSNHEYGACDYTWAFLCAKRGAKYMHRDIQFPAQADHEIAEHFWQGVNANTKVIYLSQVTSPTALRLPVEEICRRAHQAGILTVIDGAHAPGQIPLDLDTLQTDFYTGNLHKWLMAPKGAAFLYAAKHAQHLIEPLVISWGLKTEPQFSSGSDFIDHLTWTGTHDPSAYLSVPAAIQFQQQYKWPEMQSRCHDILKESLPGFSALTGKPILYAQEHQYGQMAAIELPSMRDLLEFKTVLYDQYQIEIPHIVWENRHFLRISYQVYNQPEDLARLLEALQILLPRYRCS